MQLASLLFSTHHKQNERHTKFEIDLERKEKNENMPVIWKGNINIEK